MSRLSQEALQGGLPPAPSVADALGFLGVTEEDLRAALAALGERGADFGELYLQHSRSYGLTLEDGIVSRASSTVELGVGLRVVVGEQWGYAYTEDLSRGALLEAARTAAVIAHGRPHPPVEILGRAEHPRRYPVERPWAGVALRERLPLVERTAVLARQRDPSVDKVTVHWADSDKLVLIATLDGQLHLDRRPMARLWCQVTALRGGERQSNGHNVAGRRDISWFTDELLREVAWRAVDKTTVLFEARRPPAGEMPVVLAAGASGILLHEAIGHGMEADFNRKGTSIYAGRVGERVAPPFVTIVDDGTVPHARGSIDFDDEGVESQRTVLVEQGVLRSYMHDRISARHYGVAPTGNGRRQSFRHPPIPRMRCTYMENGPHSRDEVLAAVDRGIVAETFTNGQVTIGAGDFTFYIKNGWLVEGGRITAPIKDANLIGNGPEVLERVQLVAGDGRLDTGGWTCGKDGQSVPVSQGLPTVLVSRLVVGG